MLIEEIIGKTIAASIHDSRITAAAIVKALDEAGYSIEKKRRDPDPFESRGGGSGYYDHTRPDF